MSLMSRTLPVLLCLSLGAVTASAQPKIDDGGILNPASYLPNSLPNGGIASGSMFVIFGTGLGPANLAQVTSYPLPTTQGLAGTSVFIKPVGAPGATAIMIYTSATQVAAVLPSSLGAGPASMTVTYNGQTSAPSTFRIVNSAFGIFTLNQAGSGPAVVQNFNSSTDVPVNTLNKPAKPGQTVILWGTGIGPVTGREDVQPLPGQLLSTVVVRVGGLVAPVQYYGRSGCCAGVDEVVFQIPAGVSGCFVPVNIVAAGVPASSATISISPDGGPCSAPGYLGPADLQKAQSQPLYRFGTIVLTRSDSIAYVNGAIQNRQVSDLASASFYGYSADALTRYAAYTPTPGSCTTFGLSGSATTQPNPGSTALRTASGFTMQAGGNATFSKQANGTFAATLASGALNAGPVSIAYVAGSPDDVGSFNAQATLPGALVWTNVAALNNIPGDAVQTVTWNSAPAGSTVIIAGVSLDQTNNAAAGFTCVAPRPDAQSFDIPAYILAAMPVSNPFGLLTVSAFTATPFSAPGLDNAMVTFTNGVGRNVNFTGIPVTGKR